MTDETLDNLLDGGSETAPATVATPEAAQQVAEPAKAPEAEAGQPRDDSGRFAPKVVVQPDQVAAPEGVVTQPVQQPQQERPLTSEDVKGIIDERHKRQAAEERAAKAEQDAKTLRERIEQQNAQPLPNFNEDPEGFASHIQDTVQRTALSNRFDTSEFIARQSHGDEIVQKAMDWGMERSNSNRAFATEYAQQRHPIEWIVKQYNRDQLVSQIGDDADAWALKRAAELAASGQQPNPQAATPASPQSQPSAPAPRPTPSLASATSAGGIQLVPDGAESLDALLKD